jgi:hypothetical protein
LTNFGSEYPYIPGATWNGRDLDRRLLVELDWPVWESTATRLRSALTDAVIDDAVRALPPEHYRLGGPDLSTALRSRRDGLLDAARDYYRLLAKEVDVHGTERPDSARVTRQDDGTLEVALSSGGVEPYYTRRLDPKVTDEVRIFLEGGDDRAAVHGGAKGALVRVIGGDGSDQLVDSARGGRDRFYDDREGPARTQGIESKVDRRPYIAPRKTPTAVPARDWGKRWTATTALSFGPDIGALLGGGRTLTTYGFRKNPYASRHLFRAAFATGPKSYRLEYKGEFRRENSGSYADLIVRASGIDVISFHGFGNETDAPGENEFYRVTQDAFGLQPSMVFSLGPRASFRVGPVLKYVSTDDRPDRFLASQGNLYGHGKLRRSGRRLHLPLR